METKLFNLKGEEKGTINLPEFIFSAKVDPYFLHEIVRYYNDNKRVGTASTKTRTEVSGGGRKPWKQKGTGHARAGSNRSPVWRKGGVVFGPKPRDFSWDIPRTKKNSALIQMLSDKNKNESLFFVENISTDSSKTKDIVSILNNFKLDIDKKNLLVLKTKNDKMNISARNIKKLIIVTAKELNAMHLMLSHKILIEKEALEDIINRVEVK